MDMCVDMCVPARPVSSLLGPEVNRRADASREDQTVSVGMDMSVGMYIGMCTDLYSVVYRPV